MRMPGIGWSRMQPHGADGRELTLPALALVAGMGAVPALAQDGPAEAKPPETLRTLDWAKPPRAALLPNPQSPSSARPFLRQFGPADAVSLVDRDGARAARSAAADAVEPQQGGQPGRAGEGPALAAAREAQARPLGAAPPAPTGGAQAERPAPPAPQPRQDQAAAKENERRPSSASPPSALAAPTPAPSAPASPPVGSEPPRPRALAAAPLRPAPPAAPVPVSAASAPAPADNPASPEILVAVARAAAAAHPPDDDPGPWTALPGRLIIIDAASRLNGRLIAAGQP